VSERSIAELSARRETEGYPAAAGGRIGGRQIPVRTPKFDSKLRAEIAQAVAELERLRGSGDEDGERSYESRLAYLRRIAESNGVDLEDLADRRDATGPQPETAEAQDVQDWESEGGAP